MKALDRVSLSLDPGRIHALVGENGSGKSTLVKCLAGAHQPDEGRIRHRGEDILLREPRAAQQRGVAVFFQEFSLVPSLSVAENISLGHLAMKGMLVDKRGIRNRAIESLRRLGIAIEPEKQVETLSVAEQQLVEIAKAISMDMKLLILDEPTAALGPTEADRLYGVIRLLASQDVAVLYVSHRLDEVLEVADVISVLKDGSLVGTVERDQTSVQQIIRMMIGSELEERVSRSSRPSDEVRVEVCDLGADTGIHDISFEVRKGEVLGLGGVVGSGRTEIARAIFGADRVTSGEIRIDGNSVQIGSPAAAIAAGIALLPEDRKADGLFFNFSGPPNMTVANLMEILAGPWLSLARERRRARELIQDLNIDPKAMSRTVGFLSGGNQQKVVLARWLFTEARLLMLDEPTQGVDVAARVEVYRVIDDLTTRGLSILLISSDYPELLQLSDRIAVVRDGTIVDVATRGELSEHDLVEMAASETVEGTA